jgi:membrane protein
MSIGDARHMNLAPSDREPLWAIGLTALLVATGLARHQPDGHAHEPIPGRADRAELDAGPGRLAESPSEIPARGWKDILWRVYEGISEDRILANAAGVTYYALLALFPGIAAMVSIYGLFADPATVVSHLDAIAGFAPGGALEVIRDQLTRLAAQGSTTLGISFVVGLLISLWSANSGIKALFDALNAVYQEKEKRSFIRLNAVTLSFTIATIAFLLITLAGIVALPVILNYLPLPEVTGLLLEIARWPILLVLVAFGITLIYRYGPSRTEPRWQWITWGGAFAAITWLAASASSRGMPQILALSTKPMARSAPLLDS